MKIEFIDGKKSMRNFMPFVNVLKPSDFDLSGDFEAPTKDDIEVIEWHKALRFQAKTFSWKIITSTMGSEMRLNRRMNSMKAILRWISKQGFEKGTIIVIDNWFVHYASVAITV